MGRTKKIRIPESTILKQILEWLRLQNPEDCYFRRVHTGGIPLAKSNGASFFRPNKEGAGISDIIGRWKKRSLAIEVKSKPNKPTPDQLEYLRNVEMTGGIAIVAYSFDDVIRELRAHDGEAKNHVVEIEGTLPG